MMLLAILASCSGKEIIEPHACFDEDHRESIAAADEIDLPVAFHFFEGGELAAYEYDTETDTRYEPADLESSIITNMAAYFSGTGFSFSLDSSTRYSHPCEGYIDYDEFFDQAPSPVSGALNVYVCEGTYLPNDVETLSIMLGASDLAGGKVVTENYEVGYYDEGTVPHETGHAFGLFHTHETMFGVEEIDGSNSEEAGDLITDTPADSGTCEFDFDEDPNELICPTDDEGIIYEPLENNMMSYYYDYSDADPAFTGEQSEVMRCVVTEERYSW